MVLNDQNLGETLSVRLTPMNLILIVSTLLVVVILVTTLAIVKTPLKELIPGYADPKFRKELNVLMNRFDSINYLMEANDLHWQRIKAVLNDSLPKEYLEQPGKPIANFLDDEVLPDGTPIDSLLRAQLQADLSEDLGALMVEAESINKILLANPLGNNAQSQVQFTANGYEINLNKDETILNMLEGTVLHVFNAWDGKSVVLIQHPNNLTSSFTFYGTVVVKKATFIKSGAVIGRAQLPKGMPQVQVHVALWQQGKMVNILKLLR